MPTSTGNSYAPPVGVYYPSCVVNLIIRFDERFNLSDEGVRAFSTADLLPRAEAPERNLGSTLILSGQTRDNLTHVNGRIPKKASVELPAYRQAGKFNLTFDFRDLPIDPRLVRSVGVRIYMDAVSASNFAEGITGPTQNGERASILPRTGRPSIVTPRLENLVLAGTADTWHVSHTSSGSEVTLEGRDQRAMLLDSPIKPEMLKDVPLKKNIREVVQWIVSKHPLGEQVQITVHAPVDEWPDKVLPSPTLQGNLAPAQPRVRQGADGEKAKASTGGDPKGLNFWDLITRYCTLVGAVPYFKGDNELWIRPARSLYAQQAAAEQGRTPFSQGLGRDVGEPRQLAVRRMVFGHNVEEMTFERKFNGFTPRVIHVVSYDSSSGARGSKRLLDVYWPEEAAPRPTSSSAPDTGAAAPASSAAGAEADSASGETPLATDIELASVSNVAPSGAAANKDELLISVPGINDKDRLLKIAQDIYEELGRGEMGGSVKTKSLASFGGSNDDPDMMRLRPGDAVTITVDGRELSNRAPLVSPLNRQAQSDDGQLIREIAARVGDPNLARVIVATSRNYVFELQNNFRTSNVKYEWDAKSGISVSFDFHNYVEARNAVTPIKQPKRGAAQRSVKESRSTGQHSSTGRITEIKF